MDDYTNKTLVAGEKVILNSRQSKWELYFNYILCSTPVIAILFTLLFGAGLFWATVWLIPTILILGPVGILRVIDYFFTEFSVTNKKVLSKSGVFSRKTDELQLKKIEGVDVKQGLIERMLGYGTLVMSGTGTQKVCFYSIDNPLDVKKKIDTLI